MTCIFVLGIVLQFSFFFVTNTTTPTTTTRAVTTTIIYTNIFFAFLTSNIMSAVSATALTALRVRVAAARLARSKVSSPGQVTKSLLSSSRDGSSRTYATRGIPFTASMTAYFPHPRLQARLSRLAAREIPISRAAAPDDDAQTRTTSSDKTTTEAPDPHLADDDESAGEGASGHDIVGKAQDKLNNIVADATDYLDDATDAVEEDDPIVGDPKGWDTSGAQNWDAKPTDEISSNEKSPAAYIAGEVGYSKFYPPEARDYAYKRRIMVAVDGSVESEHAVQWAVQHICRSGDLLYIVHCAISIDPRLATFYGPLGDQISDDSPRPSVSGTVTRKSQIAFPCDRTPHHPMYDESWAPKQLLEVRVS